MTRWLGLALALVGCESTPVTTTTTDTGCRNSAECSPTGPSTLVCLGPDDPALPCGIPPQEECTSAENCGGSEVCHAISDNCSPDGFGSICASPCGSDVECGPGLTCAAGACSVVTCVDDPSLCSAWEACDASVLSATPGVLGQTSGCVAISCTDDSPCGGGACVNDICQRGTGECGEAPLTPP
jgi:hypothetical protein